MVDKKVLRIAFCVAVCLFTTALVFAQKGATKSRIAVFGFLNLTGNDVFDIPAETAGNNLAFALKTLGLYEVSEPETIARNFSDSTLLKWCAKNSVDTVMYGVIQRTSKDGESYQLSVFDVAKGTTTVRKTASGQSVLDVFSVSDELSAAVLGAVTGRRIGFGSISFTNTGAAGDYSVSVDGILVEGSPGVVDQVVSGKHRVRVLSGASRSEVLSAEVTVRERETAPVSFALTKDAATPLSARGEALPAEPGLVEMVPVPGGTIEIDKVKHTVDSFLIGKYEITQGQYAEVMGFVPMGCTNEFGLGNEYPIYRVNWYDAIAFCNRLSVREGLTPVYMISGTSDPTVWGAVPTYADEAWNAVTFDSSANGYRLSTDSEWAFAAYGGTKSRRNEYSGGKKPDAVAWYLRNSGSRSHPVGVKEANELGIFDMSGNVSEWCQDWCGTSVDDFAGFSTSRAIRGGGWDSAADECRLDKKISGNPYIATDSRGFRVARRP